jgi:hypothetical protein
MQQQQRTKWSTIAWSIPEAHLRCAGHNCFSGVIFGLPFLGQTWKKALLGLARRSEPLSARLTRNTSLASGRLTRRTVLHEASAILHGATAAAARVLKAARKAPPAAFSSRETSESRRCSTVGGGIFITAAPEL